MRCGTSFFNASVFKNCLKRFWPVWAALLLSLILSLPLPVLNAGRESDADFIVRTVGGYGSIVTVFIFSILAAMTVFSWMYQAKSAGFVGSLPLRREGVFLSCALAGFAMLTLPGVLAAVLTCAAAAGSCGFAAALGLAGEWLGKFLLLSLCFFGFACLCAQLTGALWVFPTVYCLLNVAVAAFWVLISNVLRLLLSGYDGGLPMLAADLSPLVRIFLFEWAESAFRDWGGLAAYAVFGLVCAFLALLLAKGRHLETATDTVALSWLKPVFRWVFAIGFALCFANLIYLILMNEERFHFGIMGFFLVLGGFLGWIVAEMLVRKSYKVGSCLKTYPILAAVLILLVVFCAAGGLGYSAYCPDAQKVESATINCYSHSCTTDDPAEIEAIRSIHRELAGKRVSDSGYGNIQLVYRLRGGKTVSRSFSREALTGESERAYRQLFERQLRGGLERMLTEPDLLLSVSADRYTGAGDDWVSFSLEDEESRELLRRGILLDADAGTLQLFDAWYLDGSVRETEAKGGHYSLSLQSWRRRTSEEGGPGAWDDPYDGSYYSVTVTPAAKNTWAMLETFAAEWNAADFG